MSLHPDVLDALLAAGASAEMIVAAVKADATLDAQRVTDRRAKDRDRQQRHRESRRVTVTKRDKGSNDKDILTSKTEVTEASASSPRPWACPPNVNPDHWRDFRRNRRTRHLTDSETAYRGQLKALEQLADDEWPPGRLVEHAAAKGWGSINDPRVSRHGERPDHKRSNWETALAANMGSSSFS